MKKPRIRTRDDLLARIWERVVLLALHKSPRRVYFIQCSEGPIKIGWSVDTAARVRALQTAHAYPLKVLAEVPGDYRIETWVHHFFADTRIHGEWFRDTESLRELIEIVKTATFDKKTGKSGI